MQALVESIATRLERAADRLRFSGDCAGEQRFRDAALAIRRDLDFLEALALEQALHATDARPDISLSFFAAQEYEPSGSASVSAAAAPGGDAGTTVSATDPSVLACVDPSQLVCVDPSLAESLNPPALQCTAPSALGSADPNLAMCIDPGASQNASPPASFSPAAASGNAPSTGTPNATVSAEQSGDSSTQPNSNAQAPVSADSPSAQPDPSAAGLAPADVSATVNATIKGLQYFFAPVDQYGNPLEGPLNIYSNDPFKLFSTNFQTVAENAYGYTLADLPYYPTQYANVTLSWADKLQIWGPPSQQAVTDAMLGGNYVLSVNYGAVTAPNMSIQTAVELPAVAALGSVLGALYIVGGAGLLMSATSPDTPDVLQPFALVGGAAGVGGGTVFIGGALAADASLMAGGAAVAETGGLAGLPIVAWQVGAAAYNFGNEVAGVFNDLQNWQYFGYSRVVSGY